MTPVVTSRTRKLLIAAAVFDFFFGFIFAFGAIHSLGWWFLLLLALAGMGLWVGWCAEKNRPLRAPLAARSLCYLSVAALLAYSFYADSRNEFVEITPADVVFVAAFFLFLVTNAALSARLSWRLARGLL